MAKCYPANLVLEGQDCLVVGGGRTAERKVTALLEAGASVRVVAKAAGEGLKKLAGEGKIALAVRDAEEADLGEALVVVLATDDEALNRRLAEAAKARRQLVNVVDVPELCTFYVPASVRRGPILLTVGSDGAAPALTKHLRQRIEEQFGEEWGELAEIMGELRDSVKTRFTTQAERAAAWERVLASEALELLREGKREQARDVAGRAAGGGA